MHPCPLLCPRGPAGLQSRWRASSRPSVAVMSWANFCPPEGEAGRDAALGGRGGQVPPSQVFAELLPGQVDPGSPPWLIADN